MKLMSSSGSIQEWPLEGTPKILKPAFLWEHTIDSIVSLCNSGVKSEEPEVKNQTEIINVRGENVDIILRTHQVRQTPHPGSVILKIPLYMHHFEG